MSDFLEAAEFLANLEKQKLDSGESDASGPDATGIVKKVAENEVEQAQPNMVNEMLLND